MNDADTIREMMAAWNRLMAAARAQYPHATDEQVYRMVSAAMTRAVGASGARVAS